MSPNSIDMSQIGFSHQMRKKIIDSLNIQGTFLNKQSVCLSGCHEQIELCSQI